MRKLTVPVGDVLVGDSGGNVEHDDTTVTVDVITISQSSELLLTSGIPHIELEFTIVGEETKRAIINHVSTEARQKSTSAT
jgi:hypothetical protein